MGYECRQRDVQVAEGIGGGKRGGGRGKEESIHKGWGLWSVGLWYSSVSEGNREASWSAHAHPHRCGVEANGVTR